MDNCLICGKEASYEFQTIEVHTLHVRDLKGEKRVQALGEDKTFTVCEACARARLTDILTPSKKLKTQCLLFSLLAAAGIVLAAITWTSNGALRLMGLAALVGSLLVIMGNFSTFQKGKREFASLPEDKALYRAAWECVKDAAPKKHDENDVTYIPVDEETLRRKNGDLMILFDLLPEIAVQAYNRIHGIAEEEKQ